MSKYAVMPIEDYSETCNTIRGLMGSSEVIKSRELPEKINVVADAKYNEGWNDGYGSGYGEGYYEGTQETYNYLVDENSFTNTKITNKKLITVKDVSEVTHKVKLKIINSGIFDLSTVTVYKYGKSIVNRFWGDSIYLTRQGVAWLDCRNGSIYAKGTTPSTNVSYYNYILDMNQELEDGKEYIMFNNNPKITFFLMTQNNETGEKKTICSVANGEVRFTVDKTKYTYLNSFLQIWGGVTVDATVTPIIVEAGVREVLKPNKNGVIETDSVFPAMTFVADNNVLMEFEYNKSNSNHQAEDFWNGYQAMGSRTDYRWACINSNFIVDREGKARWNFTPKYDVKVNVGNAMFRCFNNNSSGGIGYEDIYVDLPQHFENLGVKFDTSNLTDAGTMFYNAQGIKRIPVINLSKCIVANTTANFIGQMARTVTIDGIISSENTAWGSNSFVSGTPLNHCIFSGVIGKSFYISNAKNLDYESLLSIIDCLIDNVDTGTTLTLTLGSTLIAKLSEEELALIEEKGWNYK